MPATMQKEREERRAHEHTLKTYRDEQIVIVAGHARWSTWLWEGLDSVTVCEPCPEARDGTNVKVLSYSSRVDGVANKFCEYLQAL